MADIRLSTPVGFAVYPRLKTPDTKFDELGIYKADVAVPLADAEPLMQKLNAIFKAHTGKPPKKSENTMFYLETDSGGEETGNVVFKLRVKNRITKKSGELWDRRPKLFDAALKPIDVNPWGGSKMVVSFDVYEWDAGGKVGVSLQPAGVQIIELVTGGGPTASSMGFAAQEGYVAPTAEGSEGFTDKSEGADDCGAGEADSDAENGDY